MEFRALGPLEVVHKGRPLDLGPHEQRSLLALLLIHAGNRSSRLRLPRGHVVPAPPRSDIAPLRA